MKIIRSDSGGESSTNERLQILRKMLFYRDLKNIYMLHDHKGLLTVTWELEPSEQEKEILEDAWNFLCEFEIVHKIIKTVEL